MYRYFLFAILICAAAHTVRGERARYSNANRDVFVLPENAALGGADICFARDGVLHSNPAAAPLDSLNKATLSYAGFYANTFSTSMASYMSRVGKNAGIGAGVGYLYVPDIIVTTSLDVTGDGDPIWDPEKLSYTSFSEIAFSIVYGQRILERRGIEVSAGARLHGMRRRLPDDLGYGIGVDAGAVLGLPRRGLRFSLLVDDITTNYIYWGSSYKDISLPRARLGAGWRKEIPYLYGAFTVVYATPDVISDERVWVRWNVEDEKQVLVEEDNAEDLVWSFLYQGRYGLEYFIRNTVALRAGFTRGRFAFGGGLRLFSALSVDFSYALSELDGTYYVSTGYLW
ncbi:MAG: hypothetical protein GF418_02905 [Chitinivibrionales bacterium]|nr:hypothetical protein [Chitinivibrionales bacterium]MBD3394552.1 hypothetical protein [Chitinivibrionales bacterium]